jgi:uncharacterized membrane protein
MLLKRYFENLEPALDKLDDKKNQLVFDTIKGHWPTEISKNHIALFRIGVAMTILIILLEFKSSMLITLLFVIGMLAGYVNEVTPNESKENVFAIILEPIADRALIIPVAFYLLLTSNTLLFAAMMLMEICNAFITLSIENSETLHQTNIFGKSKTLFQIAGCIGLLLFWRIPFFNMLFVIIIWSSLVLFMLSMRQKIFSISTHHAHQTNPSENLQYALKEERTIQAH